MAVKLFTGEPSASNYLRPEPIADVVREVDGTIVENNTAYGGARSETAIHTTRWRGTTATPPSPAW